MEDNNASRFSSFCLSTSVVLKNILENFSNSELVTMSLINKQWNFEARSVMRHRGNLFASQHPRKSCQDVLAFLSDVGNMNVIPFSGIRIVLSKQRHRCRPSSTQELDSAHLVNLRQLQWKYLSITVDDEDVEQLKNCPVFLLLENILWDISWLLVELELNLDSQGIICLGKFLSKCNYGRLKTLKFGYLLDTSDGVHIKFIRELVAHARAPCLQEVHMQGWINFNENFLEGTSAELVTDREFDLADDDFSESLVGVVKLKGMRLLDLPEDFSLEMYHRTIPGLLQSSQSTLYSLNIDSVFAVLLMSYGICLEKVGYFQVNIDYHQLNSAHPRILELLKNFDFFGLCPNLTYVRVESRPSDLSSDQIRELVHRGNAFYNLPTPNRAANIKDLTLLCCLEESNVPFFAGMFPHVEVLTLLEAPRDAEIPYGLIWEYWENLKEFAVEVSDHMMALVESVMQKWNLLPNPNGSSKLALTKNLDSVFCGISRAELLELGGKDEEYLKAVNIIPVRPSITRMRALKIFRMRLLSNGRDYGRAAGSTFMFSKVSGLLAFKRCPELSVILETDSKEIEAALSHLKPYASVVLDNELQDNVFE